MNMVKHYLDESIKLCLQSLTFDHILHRFMVIMVMIIISNTKSIVAGDPAFAKVYLREKEQVLSVMTAGDQTLYDRACALVEDAKAATGFES